MNGVSVLLIEREAGGVSTRRMDCQGVWSSGTTYITFEDVKVPVENLIGKENQGFKVVMTNFNHEVCNMPFKLSLQTVTDFTCLAHWYYHPMSPLLPRLLRRIDQVRAQAKDLW
jgi:hypothetical protein